MAGITGVLIEEGPHEVGMSEGLRASARCRQRALARRRLLERSEKVEEGRPVRPEYGVYVIGCIEEHLYV